MKRIFLFFVPLLILFSCTSKVHKKLIFDYKAIGSEDYLPSKKYDLRCDTLYLVFAGNFDEDTIHVKWENIDTTRVFTTNEISGMAGELKLGKISDSSDVVLQINNYEPVSFNVNREDQLFLILLRDSILKVRSRYYFPGFY